jgi:hypothetical protein
MAIFYRGAGVGTYWHTHDPRHSGFTPHCPGMLASPDRVMSHIWRGTTASPYVSLTRSYGVARSYALNLGRAPATAANPAFVWEIELSDPSPVPLLDPIKFLAAYIPEPTAPVPYQHDGAPNILIGLIDLSQAGLLVAPCPMPPNSNPPARAPNVSDALRTLVFSLRDAEILAQGTIPAACVRHRHDVY